MNATRKFGVSNRATCAAVAMPGTGFALHAFHLSIPDTGI
jgi:hypothetical protein